MENLMLSEVVSAVRGSFGFPADIKVENISTDTREIGKESVFIALKGERFDGHDFAAQAMEKGACAVITEKAVAGAKCIIVDSTYRALLDIAGYYKDKFPVKRISMLYNLLPKQKTHILFLLNYEPHLQLNFL